MRISGLPTAVAGLRRQAEALGGAAEKIARATAIDPIALPREEFRPDRVNSAEPVASAMLEALVARRMFIASLRMAQATNETVESVLDIAR